MQIYSPCLYDIHIDDVTFKELINDLKDMTEWWLLGKAVGIPQAQLLIIGRDEKTTDACKIAVLRKWTKLEKPTWFKVVYSLFKCGMTTLGWELAAKHCKYMVVYYVNRLEREV